MTGYDAEGRVAREVSQAGTVTRTVYDGLDRTVGVYVGTVDALGWSPTNVGNLVQTESDVYDFGGVGDSDLTQRTMFSGTSAEPNQIMLYAYDWRDRQVGEKDGAAASLGLETDGVHRPITITTYDNLGEVTETQTFDGDGVALTNAGGVLQVPAANLLRGMSESAYDLQGKAYQTSVYSVSEAAQTAGQVGMTPLVSDMWYDSRGEQIAMDPAGGSWTKDVFNGLGEVIDEYQTDGAGGNPGSVSGDTVLSQVVTSYDADQEATEVVSTEYGSVNQVDYSGTYYDASGRDVAMVDVGNNGGVAWAMPAAVPARSTSTHVTSYWYNWQGEQSRVTDPSGLISRTRFDALGRTLRTVEDAGGSANGSDGSGPQNKTTSYTYGPAGVTSLTAVDSGVGQTTQYVYGVSPGNGSTMYSRDVMRVTEYPNPTTGQPSAATNEEVSSTVDNLGQPLTSTDRNGTTQSFTYDSLGRLTLDAVTTLGNGVDGTVRAIGTTYDGQGNVSLTTSYSTPNTSGTVGNQVEDLYDGFGQLVQEYQAVGGAVVGNTPSVQYTYSEGMNNSDRLTSMVYPDGYQIDSVYNSGTDSAVSRVSSWADDQTVDGNSTTLESYGYLGVGEVLTRTDQAQTQTLTLDPFGRVGTEAWTTIAGTSSSYTYTYDADSNVLTKTDNVNSSLSQTYQYDGLNQVTSYAESSGTQSQSYTYDSLGNRTGVTTNGSSSGTWSANAQNEITSVGTTGSAPIYDADGNMTADQTGLVYTYDAWNRLVRVSSSAGTLETMSYDGLGRLVVDTNAGLPTNRYYSLADQVLEEQSGGVYTARYVWSEVYVNALVFRDTNASGLSATSSYTRVWAQQDANFNVMALVNASGAVAARFDYTAFGVQSTVSGGVTNWVYGWQGMRVDGVTNWVESQSRWYSPTLGSWTSVDPLGFGGQDQNLYRLEGNRPVNAVDSTGLLADSAAMLAYYVARSAAVGGTGAVAVSSVALTGVVVIAGGSIAVRYNAFGSADYLGKQLTRAPRLLRIAERITGAPRIPISEGYLRTVLAAKQAATRSRPPLNIEIGIGDIRTRRQRKACFAADTPIRTGDGWTKIQDIKVGDLVLSREEYDPSGPVLTKRVDELFVVEAEIWRLTLGGRTIETTAEHPFYVYDKGWVPCVEITKGDRVATETGGNAIVEAVTNTNKFATVYNFSIEDFHTYFVGCDEWGFSVWAHNACVVKGGLGPPPKGGWKLDTFKVAGVEITGTSASSEEGKTLAELSAGIPNGQVRITTTEAIVAAGGTIVPTFRKPTNPYHVTIVGLTLGQLDGLFGPPIPNPGKP